MSDMTARPRVMFHVKHHLALALAAAVLVITGCSHGTAAAVGWAAPVGANGLVLVQSGVGRLTAVKPDGSRIGDFELKGPMTRDFLGRNNQGAAAPLYAKPVVQGDAVYVASYRGRVARLRFADGQFNSVWEKDLGENVVATPSIRGDRLYVSSENGHLLTLDIANGNIVTSSRPTSGRVWGAPQLRENRLYIGTLDSSELLAVNPETGVVDWRQEISGATAADLVAEGDLLVVASFDRTIHALELASGTVRWQFKGDGWFVGTPLSVKDGIYAGTMTGSVYGIDHTGKQRWQFKREGLEFRSSPMLVGDTLIVADRNGTFVGLDAATGVERWTRQATDAKIDADGVVLESGAFYATVNRRLLRVDAASGEIQTFNVQPSNDGN